MTAKLEWTDFPMYDTYNVKVAIGNEAPISLVEGIHETEYLDIFEADGQNRHYIVEASGEGGSQEMEFSVVASLPTMTARKKAVIYLNSE